MDTLTKPCDWSAMLLASPPRAEIKSQSFGVRPSGSQLPQVFDSGVSSSGKGCSQGPGTASSGAGVASTSGGGAGGGSGATGVVAASSVTGSSSSRVSVATTSSPSWSMSPTNSSYGKRASWAFMRCSKWPSIWFFRRPSSTLARRSFIEASPSMHTINFPAAAWPSMTEATFNRTFCPKPLLPQNDISLPLFEHCLTCLRRSALSTSWTSLTWVSMETSSSSRSSDEKCKPLRRTVARAGRAAMPSSGRCLPRTPRHRRP
mmetsp:Transcript_98998/g.263024  ORF Transcript_98998/g.263024 Transcript_98998/m.263024 type:complete len:261 (+) Transcript_98998:1363-2145(+)